MAEASENYSDRKSASFIGLYNGSAKDQFYKGYIRPQESGYKNGYALDAVAGC